MCIIHFDGNLKVSCVMHIILNMNKYWIYLFIHDQNVAGISKIKYEAISVI